MHAGHNVANVLDFAAVAAAIGGLVGYLPAIATVLSIAWLAIQIVHWFHLRRHPEKCNLCGRPTRDL